MPAVSVSQCIEMNWDAMYFRLNKPLDSERAAFPKVGSKFRYMGRTQHQVGGAPESNRPALTIQRGAGTRFMSRGPTDTVDTSSK